MVFLRIQKGTTDGSKAHEITWLRNERSKGKWGLKWMWDWGLKWRIRWRMGTEMGVESPFKFVFTNHGSWDKNYGLDMLDKKKKFSKELEDTWSYGITHTLISEAKYVQQIEPVPSQVDALVLWHTIVLAYQECMRHVVTNDPNIWDIWIISHQRHAINPGLLYEQINLEEWGKFHYQKGSVHEIIDSNLSSVISPKCLIKFGELARNYLKKDGSERPSMEEVVGVVIYENQEFFYLMQEEPTITDEYALFGSTGVAIIHGKSTTDSSKEARCYKENEEWRQSVGLQSGMLDPLQVVHDPLPNPSFSATCKKQTMNLSGLLSQLEQHDGMKVGIAYLKASNTSRYVSCFYQQKTDIKKRKTNENNAKKQLHSARFMKKLGYPDVEIIHATIYGTSRAEILGSLSGNCFYSSRAVSIHFASR
ncbi:serine-threonine/tyrosine-protein kinase catalytic domain-containing protein [Artemisia annua]|uniref:Serine-threonine/tyrosine-protein kinase catalytic domain-containing protein n=1 Tax=Artemisia annua TaxID=35608 RepID=A0A2U1LJG4_ARTAN|nr:serine-threonine/tyrosine-protein kinase catalytic domain-containing protein [Artemisia annua]